MIAKPRIDTSKFSATERQNALIAIYPSAGYQVVLDLIEEIVTESENLLIGEDPENEKAVIKFQYRAHAQRLLFQKLETRVSQIVSIPPLTPEPEMEKTLEERALENAELIIGPEE